MTRRAEPAEVTRRVLGVAQWLLGTTRMTPLHFEQQYQAGWDELAAQVRLIFEGRNRQSATSKPIAGEHVAALYRRACEHLALARARAYPRYLIDRLERITADAHQVIYQRREFGFTRAWHAIAVRFSARRPRARRIRLVRRPRCS